MILPEFLSGLFQNYVFESLDDQKHAALVIKTVLSRGTWGQVKWLFEHYGADRVREVFLEDCRGLRTLPESTRRLWALVWGDPGAALDDDEVEKWRPRRVPPSARNVTPQVDAGSAQS